MLVEVTKEGISWFDLKRRLLDVVFLFGFVLFCFICCVQGSMIVGFFCCSVFNGFGEEGN